MKMKDIRILADTLNIPLSLVLRVNAQGSLGGKPEPEQVAALREAADPEQWAVWESIGRRAPKRRKA